MITASDICWELDRTPDSFDPDEAVDATIKAEAYRRLARQALQQLHDVTLERDILREQRSLDRRRTRETPARASSHRVVHFPGAMK